MPRIITKTILGILVLYLLMVLVLAGLDFSVARQAYQQAAAGKKSLQTAIDLAQAKYFDEAKNNAKQAQEQFRQAEEKIKIIQASLLTSVVPGTSAQIKNLQHLLATAQDLSQEVEAGIEWLERLTAIFTPGKTFSQLSKEEKAQILAYIYDSGLELAQIRLGIADALAEMEKVDFYFFRPLKIPGILTPLRPQILNFKTKLAQTEHLLAQAVPASRLIPIIFGYPKPKTFLFLLQNSDELRSTGGFIGTYGIVKTNSGEIEEFETHDIYHLDMPVKDKINIAPPPPIAKYLNKKWYLRDANWAPDFPTTAQKALWFFKKEVEADGKKPPAFGGVIAVTPQVIKDLLNLSGPIIIEGQEYNSQNFTQLLEYRVEKGYVEQGVSSWQRKEVIGEIAKQLKIKLLDMPISRWPEIFAVLDKSIERKDTLFYFTDKDEQDLALKLNAAGEIKPVQSDYLLVVDFNMAAFKTDAVMKKEIYYKVEQRYDGLTSLVRLTYEHQGGFDWRTTRYQTYTRVYVPAGSKLLSVKGVDKKDVYVGQEFGKTFFGAFFKVEPGHIGALSFTYQLPEQISKKVLAGSYELLAQKQPGNRISSLTVDFNFKNKIQLNRASLPPAYDEQILNNNHQLIWRGGLEKDLEFKILGL